MIQPIAEPAQALGVYKMSVGTASPRVNGERVPPRGGERRLPRNSEREDGGGEKRIAAQEDRASQPRKQQHRGKNERRNKGEAARARCRPGVPKPAGNQAPGEQGENGGGFRRGE